MAGLSDIEGISAAQAEKLKTQGLHTTEDLLKAGATPKSRGDLAAVTGITESLILRWTNMADLFRIRGVAEQYADLLEASGVDTVPELAQRNPENLLAKMLHVNEEKGLVNRVPTQEQVAAWVAEAKTLPRMISYGRETGGPRHEALGESDTKSGAGDSGTRQAETLAGPSVWAVPPVQADDALAESDAKSTLWDNATPRGETPATPSVWAVPPEQPDEGVTASETKSGAWDSGVRQAETPSPSVRAVPPVRTDEPLAGSDTKSGAWDSGVRQADAAAPSRTAKEVHEWWGKRLWKSLRGTG